MSTSNGTVNKSLIEKQEMAAVVKQLVAGLETKFNDALVKALASQQSAMDARMEAVRREALVPIHKHLIDTGPIADANKSFGASLEKALDRLDGNRSAERAVLKDLIDAALTMPVPMVQAPDCPVQVNPTPVTLDLSELADVLRSNTDMLSGILDQILRDREDRAAMTRVIAELASACGALTAALSKPRVKEPVTCKFNDDGTEFTING